LYSGKENFRASEVETLTLKIGNTHKKAHDLNNPKDFL
jgi:hypothetical protein